MRLASDPCINGVAMMTKAAVSRSRWIGKPHGGRPRLRPDQWSASAGAAGLSIRDMSERLGRPLRTTQPRIPPETTVLESEFRLRACILIEAEMDHSSGRQGPFSMLTIGQTMDTSINRDILRSCNELSNILHNLEFHVAPADLLMPSNILSSHVPIHRRAIARPVES
jgi:hypothetical protein